MTFRCDEYGALWFNDWNRGSDDHARQSMENMLRLYEGGPREDGTWSSASVDEELAAECRQALAEFDAFWIEEELQQLQWMTETQSV